MQLTEIICVNVLKTKTAFGVLASDMTQSVFIPAKVSVAASVVAGGKYMAAIVPNNLQPDKTKWFCVNIGQQDAESGDLGNRILAELENGAGYAGEIAEALDEDEERVEVKLRSMSASGLIASRRVYALTNEDLEARE